MFKDSNELKQFILWSREQKIKKVKVKGVEVEFSDFAWLHDEDVQKNVEENIKKFNEFNTKTWTDPEDDDDAKAQDKADDDLLFWSSEG